MRKRPVVVVDFAFLRRAACILGMCETIVPKRMCVGLV